MPIQSSIRFRRPNSTKQIERIPAQNVVWSSGTAWQGVIAEAYRFDDLDTPEFQVFDYNLVVHTSSPALISLKANRTCDIRIRRVGDISIIPPGTTCQVRSSEPHEVLLISITQSLMVHAGFEMHRLPPFELPFSPYLRDGLIEHISWALKGEAESHYDSGETYGQWLGLALAARLLGHYSAKFPSLGQRGGMRPVSLRRVIDYIDSNLASSLSLASLANIAGLSRYRFAHNFKSAMGLPPHKYVLGVRIKRAKQMLRETDLSILEIANRVGCPSLGHFYSLFRRETGAAPGVFRDFLLRP